MDKQKAIHDHELFTCVGWPLMVCRDGMGSGYQVSDARLPYNDHTWPRIIFRAQGVLKEELLVTFV